MRTLIIASLAMAAAFPAAAAAQNSPVGRTYSSEWGQLTFNRWTANEAHARYEHENGRIEAQRQGNQLRGYWYQPSGARACSSVRNGTRHWGRIQFQLSADLSGFVGQWSHCNDAPSESWNGSLSGASQASAAQPAAPHPSVGRAYDTDWGRMTISQWGAGGVSGRYEHENGTFDGTASGDRVTGYWYQPSGARTCSQTRNGTRHWGRLEFAFNADASAFTGRWSHCNDAPSDSWNGRRAD